MKNQKPLIGIPTRLVPADRWHNWYDMSGVGQPYVDSLVREGGLPIAIPNDLEILDRIFPMLDGVLLAGGDDINPAVYHQEDDGSDVPDRDRDKCEFALLHKALATGLPVLGVCRGMQMVNVALGGTLYQQIDKVWPKATHTHQQVDKGLKLHPVSIQPESELRKIAGAGRATVASDHHQAINRLAPGLEVTALSPEGIIEAVEMPGQSVLGIQWHPERLPQDVFTHSLFKYFVGLTSAEKTATVADFLPQPLPKTA